MQIISDVHLEYRKTLPVFYTALSENICLVGDIGHPGTSLYRDFISKCSLNYKNVFMIYGNHEYFSVSKGVKKEIELFKKRVDYAINLPKNVYFLNDSCVYLNTITNEVIYNLKDITEYKNYVKIIGSTLWTDNDNGKKSSNFKHIYIDYDKKLTYEEQCELFKKSKKYIIDEVNSNINIQCILLTHYGTHKLCTRNSLDGKDTNHISELFTCSNLIGCINGHTHSNISVTVPGTSIKLLSNCLGCISEDVNRVKYDKSSVFNYINSDYDKKLTFEGFYCDNNNNDYDIINLINNRPNPEISIGEIDSSTSYILSKSSRDLNNSIIYANKSFEKLTGYTLDEIKGRNCRFMQAPGGVVKKNSKRLNVDNDKLFDLRNMLFSEKECQFVLINFKKSGERFFNCITIIPIIYKNEKCFVGLQLDVTHINNFELFNQRIIDENIIRMEITKTNLEVKVE